MIILDIIVQFCRAWFVLQFWSTSWTFVVVSWVFLHKVDKDVYNHLHWRLYKRVFLFYTSIQPQLYLDYLRNSCSRIDDTAFSAESNWSCVSFWTSHDIFSRRLQFDSTPVSISQGAFLHMTYLFLCLTIILWLKYGGVIHFRISYRLSHFGHVFLSFQEMMAEVSCSLIVEFSVLSITLSDYCTLIVSPDVSAF